MHPSSFVLYIKVACVVKAIALSYMSRLSTYRVLVSIVPPLILGYNNEEKVHVCLFADTWQLLTQVLPKDGGFFGNCFYPRTVTVEDVVSARLLDVIKKIRDGKARLPMEFAKWASGDVKVDPYQLTFEHNVLFVSDWTRLGFFEVDYGWGAPRHIVPFTYADYMAGALLAPKKGTRIMTLLTPAARMGRLTTIGNHRSLKLNSTSTRWKQSEQHGGNRANGRCGAANCCSFFGLLVWLLFARGYTASRVVTSHR
jgi:hypothetical protein